MSPTIESMPVFSSTIHVTGNNAHSMVLTDRLNVLHSQGALLQPFIYSVS